ncbi:MAG: hypothetical protein ACLUGF_08655 [Clostridium sp.]
MTSFRAFNPLKESQPIVLTVSGMVNFVMLCMSSKAPSQLCASSTYMPKTVWPNSSKSSPELASLVM